MSLKCPRRRARFNKREKDERRKSVHEGEYYVREEYYVKEKKGLQLEEGRGASRQSSIDDMRGQDKIVHKRIDAN